MGRGLAARPVACAEHPHHDAVDHCDACGRRFCRECLIRGGPELLCASCRSALEVMELEREALRQPSARLQPKLMALAVHRPSIIAGSVIALVLALLAVSAAVQVTGATWQNEVGAVAGRAALADQVLKGEGGAAVGVPSPTATPTAAPTRIPTLLVRPPEPVAGVLGVNPAALTDGQVGARAAAWRTLQGRVTAELRWSIQPSTVGRVLFDHSAAFPQDTWAREVEVWLSPAPTEPQTILAGRWTLAQTIEPQSFALSRTLTYGARLRVLSNYGSGEYTSLAEFALLGA